MKKFKIVLIIVILFSLSFCSKDDDSVGSSSHLIGKWKIESTSKPEYYDVCAYEGWLQFKTDKTYEAYDECYEETDTGTWTLNNNNRLVVTADAFPIPISLKIISLTSSTLILEFPDFGDGIENITYKKI